MPISTLSAEQLIIKKEQSVVKKTRLKGDDRPGRDGMDTSAEDAVFVTISPPPAPPLNQNPFAQLSNSIMSPFSRAGSSLTASVLSMFDVNAATADVSGVAGAAPRRKKRASVAERLSCAASRDSDEQPSGPGASSERGIFSAVFAACGGSQQESESVVSVTAPSSDSLENAVAVRKQKKAVNGPRGPGKSRGAGTADGGAVSVEEMDV
jgi:hypothetical protein